MTQDKWLARISAEQNRLRLMWLANAVLACDYGDNDTGHIGWRIRSDVRDEPLLFGPSINAAIDAAIAMEAGTGDSAGRQASPTPPNHPKQLYQLCQGLLRILRFPIRPT